MFGGMGAGVHGVHRERAELMMARERGDNVAAVAAAAAEANDH